MADNLIQQQPAAVPPIDVASLFEQESERRRLLTQSLTFEGPGFRRDEEIKALGELFRNENVPTARERQRRDFLGSTIIESQLQGRSTFSKSERPPNPRERAIFFGIEPRPDGVGLGTRLAQGFGDTLLGAKQGLKKEFGVEVDVRLDSDLQNIVFDHPITGKATLVNPIGFDAGDLAEFAPHLLTIIPEIAGMFIGAVAGTISVPATTTAGAVAGFIAGLEAIPEEAGLAANIAGGVLGAPVGAVLGAVSGPVGGFAIGGGLGAYIGEQIRLHIGRRLDYNEMKDPEINRRATITAGLSMLAGGIFAGLARLGTTLATPGAGPFVREFEAETLEPAIIATQREIDAIFDATGVRIQPTLAQTLRATGRDGLPIAPEGIAEAVEGVELALARKPGTGKSLVARRDEQLRQARELEEKFLPIARELGFDDLNALGRTIRKQLAANPELRIGQIEARTEVVRKEAEVAANKIVAPTPSVAGENIRTVFQTAREKLGKVFDERYTALSVDTPDVLIKTAGIKKFGKERIKFADKELLPSETVTAADRKTLGEILSLDGETVSFAKVQRALRITREIIRKGKGGKLIEPRNLKNIKDLQAVLLKARNEALKDQPELAAKVAALENEFRIAKTEIDRKVIGAILTRREGGNFNVPDEKIVDKILASSSGARDLAAVIDDPLFPQFAGARESIQEGLLAKYRSKVIDPETGIVNVARHKAFMQANRESLRPFFTQREFNLLTNAKTSAKSLIARETKAKKLIADIEKEFGIKIQKFEAVEVVNGVFAAGSRETLALRLGKLKEVMRGHPDKWLDFQNAYVNRIRNKIMKGTASRQRVIDIVKLDNLLQLPQETAALEAVLGPEFVEGMGLVRKVVFITERRQGGADAFVEASRDIADVWAIPGLRVVARPLSRPGLALTSVAKFGRAGLQKAMVKLVEDPARLLGFMKIRGAGPTVEKYAVFFAEIGATELALDFGALKSSDQN